MEFVRVNNTLQVPTPLYRSYSQLANNMYSTLNVNLKIVDGYKNTSQVLDELRSRIKDKQLTKSLRASGVSRLALSDPLKFEPPFGESYKSLRDPSGGELVYSIPNKPNVDPRLTGRIVVFGPKIDINPTVLYYLVHNAGEYGFLHYGPKDPCVWYWRGDIVSEGSLLKYTASQVVNTFTGELSYLL